MAENIEEYTEKRIGHHRHFKLTAERIYISQSNRFGQRYEISFMLKNIDPERDRLWFYDPYVNTVLLFVFLVSIIPFGFLMTIGKSNTISTILAVALLVGPVLIGIIRNRRVEYSSFVSTSGNRMFEIGKVGKYTDGYEQFVNTLVSYIKKKQGEP